MLPGQTCSTKIEGVDVKSFRMLLPSGELKRIVTTIVNVHNCGCFLEPDPEKCALEAIRKTAQEVQLSSEDAAILGGRIFIFIESTDEFANVYAALASTYPRPTSNVAWRILHNPPPQPPPPSPRPEDLAVGEQLREKKLACEAEPNVCVNPKTNEASAEFELKCEGLPPIVFSTDGKAGLKIGPLEISLSVGSRDRH